ncbi:hypothetical protein [uncultured Psychroserpens sp.]|uniref:hypothetical protein n=1 Tax=uncultured Psychroserpens sp. TaxID=255436 RepID=UPI00260CC651|nr:hypothetical protein [uncultured Psychroserpens sp.]
MKTKKKTYTLLFFVLIVWGTIAYKIISALNPELPEIQQNTFVATTNYKIDTKIDTFSITKVDRDPFLDTRTQKTVKRTSANIKPVKWKSIAYQGIIKQQKNRQQIFIITISDIQYLLKKGQVKDSITLVHGNAKSVTMRYKNRLRSFPLNKK